MPKNILIFADGTGQAGGVRPDQQLSNIYKLFRATRIGPDSPIDPREQVAFYDPGLGTRVQDGHVRLSIRQAFKDLAGLAVGLGFSHNVIDCYEAILERYEPGDRIFLFGFSRGGYTVRSVANVLNLCGVPTTDGEGGPLPRKGKRLRAIAREAVVRVYEHGAGHPRKKFEGQREALARVFRRKYGAGEGEHRGEVYPEFVGVFDSVAALGLRWQIRLALTVIGLGGLALLAGAVAWAASAWFGWNGWGAFGIAVIGGVAGAIAAYLRSTLRWVSDELKREAPKWHVALWKSDHYDSLLDPRISHARHALAIDETRTQFGRVIWGGNANRQQADELRFQQRWFAGNHSDIGGSYPEEESRLSDIALAWMVGEARMLPHPLLIDPSKLQLYPDASGPQHCEIFAQKQKAWWARLVPWPSAPRQIKTDAVLDPTVYERFKAESVLMCDRKGAYRPESLRGHKKLPEFY
ncbi:DUF2235 domain-containing protein [Luteimonas fraxinea]|uniref:DUF2235 domain-containing protein n=1 Tax=Luteimonas fraxinea TaxID=2901869 RepID=A0ABS8UFL0_9GAMM|nr:DUF2235 domain-containing protein [Luteimonas fraxinea]MCD9098034.1 DUF2235 domain-containing protein [Luteimonas fraxinea]UHH09241.1 DUF2235 domain-containing protein [Luteimonas fraxinea]